MLLRHAPLVVPSAGASVSASASVPLNPFLLSKKSARFERRSSSTNGNVVAFASGKGKDNKKVWKKSLQKAESDLEAIRRRSEAQADELQALTLALRTELNALREEREAFAQLVKEQVETFSAFNSYVEAQERSDSSNSEETSSSSKALAEPETREGAREGEEEEDMRVLDFASSVDVREDILGAISKVGFPDDFPAPEPQKKEKDESNTNGVRSALNVKEEGSSPDGIQVTGTPHEQQPAEEKTVLHMPAVTIGCDKIQLMDLLHTKLEKLGYYCTDEERDEWYFGESTQNAVLSFQSANGLPENGSVTEKEWEILLKDETDFVWQEVNEDDVVVDVEASTSDEKADVTPSLPEEPPVLPETSSAADALEMVDTNEFPMLREGDGGRHVRLLQLALDKKGFCVSSDEMEFWFFGDTTMAALKTFQACNQLPESGIVDMDVWAKLCVGDEEVCSIEFLDKKTSGTSEAEEEDPYNVDRAQKGVFLIGEGRYEDPKKLEKNKK